MHRSRKPILLLLEPQLIFIEQCGRFVVNSVSRGISIYASGAGVSPRKHEENPGPQSKISGKCKGILCSLVTNGLDMSQAFYLKMFSHS